MDAGYKVRPASQRACLYRHSSCLPVPVQVLMRRNSVYVAVILAGALAGERVRTPTSSGAVKGLYVRHTS